MGAENKIGRSLREVVMSTIYVIEAVRFNEQNGHVERVRWGQADTDRNIWATGPAEADVIEVADKLTSGTEVWTVMPSGADTVPGPQVRIVVHAAGFSIETVDSERSEGRTVRDMRTF
jgi:hypothetical protein